MDATAPQHQTLHVASLYGFGIIMSTDVISMLVAGLAGCLISTRATRGAWAVLQTLAALMVGTG